MEGEGTLRLYFGSFHDAFDFLHAACHDTHILDPADVPGELVAWDAASCHVASQIAAQDDCRAPMLRSLLEWVGGRQTVSGLESVLLTLLVCDVRNDDSNNYMAAKKLWNALAPQSQSPGTHLFFYDPERNTINWLDEQSVMLLRSKGLPEPSDFVSMLRNTKGTSIYDPFGLSEPTVSSDQSGNGRSRLSASNILQAGSLTSDNEMLLLALTHDTQPEKLRLNAPRKQVQQRLQVRDAVHPVPVPPPSRPTS